MSPNPPDHKIVDRTKIRDGQVANRPIYVVMAVTVDGTRDILGIWAGDGGEGAKYWLHVFTELKNRGCEDVLMLVCDGLKGLPEAVETIWPRTIVQTCVVHLLRNSFRYAARQDWDKIAKVLKPVYTAPASAASGNVRPLVMCPARVIAQAASGRQAMRVAERVRVRELDDDEGRRLLRIIRRGTGSVVTWRRAQMVLLSAQGIPVAKIAEVTFTSPDRVRDVIHDFNTDGFQALYPKYKGGRPGIFTPSTRREIKKIAKSKPAEHGLPFSAWSLAKLADFLVAEGVVDDISHEGLRVLLREEGISFQRLKTWKTSRDPDYAAKKARVEHLYAIVDGEVIPEDGEPEVVFCMDEFGPLNLQPHPGRQWAEHGGKHKDPDRAPRPRRRAPYTRPHGVRHLFAAYDLGKDKLYGHIKKTKNRSKFLEFCRYLRSLHPADVRIAIVCDNFSPHLTTKRCRRVADWAEANNVEIAYTPTNSSWLNRIEAQFTALRYFTLDGTDHPSHKQQGSMIRRYIIWRNKHAADERLREVVARANTA